MNVAFNDAAEFVGEIVRDPHAVARRVVRVTKLYRSVMQGTLTRVEVVATAKVLSGAAGHEDYDLVECRIFVGDLWGHGPEDEKVQRRAERTAVDLDKSLGDAGFVVAAGRYEALQR